MKTITRLFLVIAILGATIRLVMPAAQAAKTKEAASIVPASSIMVGNSLPYGSSGLGASYGYGLVANGITDYWATAASTTENFLFFVYPGQQSLTQNFTFTVTSPTGATVYTYTWKAIKLGYTGTWFVAYAKGNYSAPGVYTAAVYADATRIGQIPVVFAPSH